MRAIVRLQAHWQGHYQIMLIDQVWQARRCRHEQGKITADSAAELWNKLRDDYAGLAEHEKWLRERAARVGAGSRLSREDQTSLNWLRMHYETHYRIDYVTPAEETWFWQAVWRSRDGEPGTLVASSAIMLRDMMREDQARRRSQARRAAGTERAGPGG